MIRRFFKSMVLITVGGFVAAGRRTEAEIMETVARAIDVGVAMRGYGVGPSVTISSNPSGTIVVPPFPGPLPDGYTG